MGLANGKAPDVAPAGPVHNMCQRANILEVAEARDTLRVRERQWLSNPLLPTGKARIFSQHAVTPRRHSGLRERSLDICEITAVGLIAHGAHSLVKISIWLKHLSEDALI